MKNKTVDHLSLARRIRAAGRPVYIGEDDGERCAIPSDELWIHQTGGVTESRAMDWCGGTAFAIHLVITVKRSNFAISEFDLELPWKGSVRWLADPLETDGSSMVYRFGGRDPLEFDRQEVLNHRADVCRILPSGYTLKGCLLGVGDDCIPEDFRHGTMIPAFVIVYDQFWRQYRSSISLWADRSQKFLRRSRSRATRKRLFDSPDRGYPCSSLQDTDGKVKK